MNYFLIIILGINKFSHTGSTNDESDFRRDKERTKPPEMNIDEEIQKIIAESLVKAKGTSKSNVVINPLSDLKKKDLNKMKESPNKIKLITKQTATNKVIVKELDKNIFSGNTNNEPYNQQNDDYNLNENDD